MWNLLSAKETIQQEHRPEIRQSRIGIAAAVLAVATGYSGRVGKSSE
jgi:hypothetical protein